MLFLNVLLHFYKKILYENMGTIMLMRFLLFPELFQCFIKKCCVRGNVFVIAS